MKFLCCLILALFACYITAPEANANSYGRYGGWYPGKAVVKSVQAARGWHQDNVAARQANRAARQAHRGYGSAGSHSYGSAGSGGSYYSESAPAPSAPETIVEYSEPVVSGCPGGNCPRRGFILGGNRRNPLFN